MSSYPGIVIITITPPSIVASLPHLLYSTPPRHNLLTPWPRELCGAMEAPYLVGRGPGERERQKDDEEEGTPQVPVPERAGDVLPVRVGEHHLLQVVADAVDVSLQRLRHRL